MRIVKKTQIEDSASYWDLTIPDTHNFVLASGAVVHNCGTGCGFSCERQYITKLPCVAETIHLSDTTIHVGDSKLGWAKSFNELIGLLYAGIAPKWDVSNVRAAGKRLKTFGGRASGPEPLVELFEFTVALFKSAVGRKLTSIEVHDLVCKIASIVVVGGVRRASLISLSNLSDDRMRSAKVGEWWISHSHRQLANNSAVYTDRPDPGVFMKEWTSVYDSKSGERGIFNREASTFIVNAANEKRKKFGFDGSEFERNDSYEFGCNPCCLPYDALIDTRNGPISIGEIASNPSVYEVLTYDIDTNKTEYEIPTAGALTRPNAELIEIELADGSTLRLTPDHRVFTKNRGYVEAAELNGEDIILNIKIGTITYSRVVAKRVVKNEDSYDITTSKNHNFFANGILVHNSEIILRSKQFCNLSEIVARAEDNLGDLVKKAKIAAILGTLQATLTNFKFLSSRWKKNTEEERLLGVSITGVMDHPILNCSNEEIASGVNARAWLNEMWLEATKTNAEWAEALGISPAKAITCNKPSGSVGELTNAASGIHRRHAKFYIRRVRNDVKDPLSDLMKAEGVPWEVDRMNPSSIVFSFPQKAPDGALTRQDDTALKQLEIWKLYQTAWCDHKPSATITIRESEWPTVGGWVYDNFDSISGLAFLPYDGGSYKQAPFEEIDEVTYEKLVAEMPKEIRWERLSEFEKEDNTTGTQELACTSAGGCSI